MYQTSDIRNGLKVEIDKVPYEVISFQHVNPGKGASFTRTKLKNLLDGRVLEITFKSNEKLNKADVEMKKFQCLYAEADGWVLMDTETFDQITLSNDKLNDNIHYLQENMEVDVTLYNGNPVGIDLPYFVNLKVVETEPGFKGDTATNAQKPAILSTGLKVSVPLFIKEGEMVKVDTRTGKFVERAK